MEEMEYYGTNLTDPGHYRWMLDKDCLRKSTKPISDLPFDPEHILRNIPRMQAVFYKGGGYTVLGISGSPADKRPGSKCVFWVRERLTMEQLIGRIICNVMAMKIIHSMEGIVDWQGIG